MRTSAFLCLTILFSLAGVRSASAQCTYPEVSNFSCAVIDEGGTVVGTYLENADYDAVIVLRDGIPIDSPPLPGDGGFEDTPSGPHTYEVLTVFAGEECSGGICTPPIPPGDQFVRGDCNADAGFNIADAILLLAVLFTPGTPPPTCDDACDSNDDGAIDISDAIYILSALFGGGPLPPPPHGACGVDPTVDPLDCAAFPPCP